MSASGSMDTRSSLASVVVEAAAVRPERLELRDDAPAELVARLREREADVRVQALQRAGGAACAADAEIERRAAVAAGLVAGELPSQDARALVRRREAVGEHGVLPCGVAPALDAPCGLE